MVTNLLRCDQMKTFVHWENLCKSFQCQHWNVYIASKCFRLAWEGVKNTSMSINGSSTTNVPSKSHHKQKLRNKWQKLWLLSPRGEGSNLWFYFVSVQNLYMNYGLEIYLEGKIFSQSLWLVTLAILWVIPHLMTQNSAW